LAELIAIPSGEVAETWPLCAGFIESGLKGSETTASDLYDRCVSGDALLWFAWSDHLEAAAVTAVIDTPTGWKCVVVSAGGKNMTRWLGLLDEIEAKAKENGCNGMRLYGRKGWMRMLKDYRLSRVILDKDL